MSGTQIMSEVEAVLRGFHTIVPTNRCAQAYAELNLHGGCYLSRSPKDDIAKDVAQALVTAGFEPQGLLRQDFGAWSAQFQKGPTAMSFVVESMASSPGDERYADYRAGYQSKVTVSLFDESEE